MLCILCLDGFLPGSRALPDRLHAYAADHVTKNLLLLGQQLQVRGTCLLHELDATGVEAIAVAPIPHEGLGEAINDRLKRAAAPRPT